MVSEFATPRMYGDPEEYFWWMLTLKGFLLQSFYLVLFRFSWCATYTYIYASDVLMPAPKKNILPKLTFFFGEGPVNSTFLTLLQAISELHSNRAVNRRSKRVHQHLKLWFHGQVQCCDADFNVHHSEESCFSQPQHQQLGHCSYFDLELWSDFEGWNHGVFWADPTPRCRWRHTKMAFRGIFYGSCG